MDLLKNSAEQFNKYIGYNYTFILDCGISIKVMFTAGQFYHLAGLHYLSDIVQVAKNDGVNSAKNIFKKILNNKIPQSLLENSCYYDKVYERLVYFKNFDDVISSKLIIDFDYTKLNSKLLSRYLLYFQYDQSTYLILGLKYDEKSDIYAPETFIVDHSGNYIKNQISYNIVEVKKERFIKPKNK